MREIKAFECDFCNKYYKHKSSVKRHEDRCFKNPQNKACLTCGNFKTDYETVYARPQGDQNYGDADYDVKYDYCENTGKSFQDEVVIKRQEFQRNCNHWIPIEIEEWDEEYE